MRLPTDIIKIIYTYVDGMNHYEKYERCLFEMYYLGFTLKPNVLKSITWYIAPLVKKKKY